MFNKLLKILIFALLLSLSSESMAAKIEKVSKDMVLIQLSKDELDDYKANNEYDLYTGKGKKEATIKIVKIKNSKAVAKVVSGKASTKLFIRKQAQSQTKTKSVLAGGPNIYLGGLFSFNLNAMTVTDSLNNSTTLNGTAIGIKGFYDYPLWNSLWVRAVAGLNSFKAEKNCTSCVVDINYLTLDGYAKYMFSKATIRPWLGAFGKFLIPLGSDSTAINNDSVTTTTNYGLAFGIDYVLSQKIMLPFVIEYSVFPSGKGTSSSSISIMAGIGMNW